MKNFKMKLLIMAAVVAMAFVAVPVGTVNVSAASNTCKTFTSGKLCYKVTGNNTCTVTGLSKKCQNATSCTIPSSVTCNGKTYKVTSIANKAFANKKCLTSVKCPNSVKVIGTEAFSGCNKLTSVKLGNCVNTVKNCAFNNCTSLSKITCGNTIKVQGNNCFGNATCKISK